jgi:tetratricopeptide (TPR) repeat protein
MLQMKNHEKLFSRANQLALEGEYKKAIELYNALIESDPKNTLYKIHLSVAYFDAGDYTNVIKITSDYIKIEANAPFVHQLRGRAFFKLEELDSSLYEFNLEIKKNPDYAEVYSDRAYSLLELNRANEALESAMKASQLDPKISDAYHCMAIALNQQGHYIVAMERCLEAIELDSSNPNFFRTLGDIFYNQEDFKSAIKYYEKSLHDDTNFFIGAFQKSRAHLSSFDFENGWQLYENRHLRGAKLNPHLYQEFSKINFKEIKKLLILKEQGIGDKILFGSLLHEIDDGKREIYVEVDERLLSIFKRSFLHISFFTSQNYPIAFKPDITLGIGSLAGFLRQSTAAFKNQKIKFLESEKYKTLELKDRLRQLKTHPHQKVCGIAWRSQNKQFGIQKSIDLEYLEPIFKIPNVIFVSLQYGEHEEELDKIKKSYGVEIHKFNDIDLYHDIEALCSLVDACDFIITSSNVTVHLAGSLGKKTFLLAPRGEGRVFYWYIGLKKSLWYSSVSVFHQKDVGNWQDPITEIYQEIMREKIYIHK